MCRAYSFFFSFHHRGAIRAKIIREKYLNRHQIKAVVSFLVFNPLDFIHAECFLGASAQK